MVRPTSPIKSRIRRNQLRARPEKCVDVLDFDLTDRLETPGTPLGGSDGSRIDRRGVAPERDIQNGVLFEPCSELGLDDANFLLSDDRGRQRSNLCVQRPRRFDGYRLRAAEELLLVTGGEEVFHLRGGDVDADSFHPGVRGAGTVEQPTLHATTKKAKYLMRMNSSARRSTVRRLQYEETVTLTI